MGRLEGGRRQQVSTYGKHNQSPAPETVAGFFVASPQKVAGVLIQMRTVSPLEMFRQECGLRLSK